MALVPASFVLVPTCRARTGLTEFCDPFGAMLQRRIVSNAAVRTLKLTFDSLVSNPDVVFSCVKTVVDHLWRFTKLRRVEFSSDRELIFHSSGLSMARSSKMS